MKFKGIAALKTHEKYYILMEFAKLANKSNTYIAKVRDPDTKRESAFEIQGTGFFDAMDVAVEAKEGVLIIDVDSGEWKIFTPNELPSDLKKLYGMGSE